MYSASELLNCSSLLQHYAILLALFCKVSELHYTKNIMPSAEVPTIAIQWPLSMYHMCFSLVRYKLPTPCIGAMMNGTYILGLGVIFFLFT